MDDFSLGFFMPNRPGFQTNNFVSNNNVPHVHNHPAPPPEYNLGRSHIHPQILTVVNERWNYEQRAFEDRRRPQLLPPDPFWHYYGPSNNNDYQNQCYNHLYQQAHGHFPSLEYFPPPNIHHHQQQGRVAPPPKPARVYGPNQQQHVSPPHHVEPADCLGQTMSNLSVEREGNNKELVGSGQASSDPNINFHYEYLPLSAAGIVPTRSKKPTQVPIQAIHRNNNTPNASPPATNNANAPIPWTRATKWKPSPPPNLESPPGQDGGVMGSAEPVPENDGIARSFEQQPVNNNNNEMDNWNLMMAMVPHDVKIRMQQEMQNVCAYLQNPSDWDYENQGNMMDRMFENNAHARHGLEQFHQDFGNNDQPAHAPTSHGMSGMDLMSSPMHNYDKWLQKHDPTFYRETNEASRFEIDEGLFIDKRPIINYVARGEREFRLFDDMKLESNMIRTVYDANVLDIFNPREICSRRLLPKSVVFWPVELVLGNEKNLNSIMRNVLRYRGQSGCSNAESINSIFDISDDGAPNDRAAVAGDVDKNNQEKSDINDIRLRSLARFMDMEGIEENPMGFITFMGYNIHKLYKDLNKNTPISLSFAGPHVDRNYSMDPSHIEVMKPLDEYTMPNKGAHEDWVAAEKWRKALRFKRPMLKEMELDSLFYMFYTFCGDALQVLAAGELYQRGWRFHKILQVWLTPVEPNVFDHDAPLQNGVYRYFSYQRWEFIRDIFKITDGVLEGKPQEFSDALWS